jgi:regulatory protein
MEQESVKAKNYALRLLKIRLRSKQELEQRLLRKSFSPEIVRTLVDSFVQAGYLDDALFARIWVSSRLHNRPRGKKLIRYELLQKGIGQDDAERAVGEIGEELESRLLEDLARRRLEKLKGQPVLTMKRRLCAYLARRGFSTAQIMRVVSALIRNYE